MLVASLFALIALKFFKKYDTDLAHHRTSERDSVPLHHALTSALLCDPLCPYGLEVLHEERHRPSPPLLSEVIAFMDLPSTAEPVAIPSDKFTAARETALGRARTSVCFVNIQVKVGVRVDCPLANVNLPVVLHEFFVAHVEDAVVGRRGVELLLDFRVLVPVFVLVRPRPLPLEAAMAVRNEATSR